MTDITLNDENMSEALLALFGKQGVLTVAALYNALQRAQQRGYEAGYAQGAADEADFLAMEKQPRDVEPNEETIRAAERNLYGDGEQMEFFPIGGGVWQQFPDASVGKVGGWKQAG
jgi:hypothetical protein